jgi:biopolymer transport protein ExbD
MAVRIQKGRALGLFNLTPMIDMVFLLLIFFLVASRFEEEERALELKLPSASEAMPMTVRPREIILNIDRQGRYYLGQQPVEVQTLRDALASAVRNNPLSQSVIIRADEQVPYKYVATAVNLCLQAGVRDYRTAMEASVP